MASGLEALGAASAVLQVVSFTSDLIGACKKIYDNNFAFENDLAHYAEKISEATHRIQSHYLSQVNTMTQYQNLQNAARECHDAAQELNAEVEHIKNMHAQVKIFSTIRATLKGSSHQKKIQRLEGSLAKYRHILELEVMSHLCSSADAIKLQQEDGFGELKVEGRQLIAQLAQERIAIRDLFKGLDDLYKTQNDLTRATMVQEIGEARAAVNTHTTSGFQAFQHTAETKELCNTFLKSLKFAKINQRYNDVMDSEKATFKSVFSSYENTDGDMLHDGAMSIDERMSDIDGMDNSWAKFTEWLKSDATLFYISGKPGSGKSTLVKFVIENDRTKRLLREWKPDATIIFHFFWKIGSPEQNSIKGLLSTILYQRLRTNEKLIPDILQRYSHLSSHTEYHDWCVKDLNAILSYISERDSRHFCIFVDGLDEISRKDDLGAFQNIMNLPKIKLCVSTRPERRIMQCLKDDKDASGLLLQALTEPDMLEFARQRLQPLLSSNEIAETMYHRLIRELVGKAQGVFLWLHLATESLTSGIKNSDSADMLFYRLNELPGELENLYADMWLRLNEGTSVYRAAAARHFRYALQERTWSGAFLTPSRWRYHVDFHQPTVLQVAFMEDYEAQNHVITEPDTFNLAEMKELFEKTKSSIKARCAGLLEMKPFDYDDTIEIPEFGLDDHGYEILNLHFGRITFIHRTAHDFLVDTEAGQKILGCEMLPEMDMRLRLFQGLACVLLSLHIQLSSYGVSPDARLIFAEIIGDPELEENDYLKGKMLDIIRPLYDKQCFLSSAVAWGPQPPFLSHLTDFQRFDGFVISKLESSNSSDSATSILRESWALAGLSSPSARLVQALISRGADPHKDGLNNRDFGKMLPFVTTGTAFTNLLQKVWLGSNRKKPMRLTNFDEDPKQQMEILQSVLSMGRSCSDWNRSVLLLGDVSESDGLSISPLTELAPSSWARGNFGHHVQFKSALGVLYEANLHSLLARVLWYLTEDLSEDLKRDMGVYELLSRLNYPSVKIRYVLTFEGSSLKSWKVTCHHIPQALSISPQALPRRVFGVDLGNRLETKQAAGESDNEYNSINDLIKDPDVEEVDFKTAVLTLASEGLGFCTLKEAGIKPSTQYEESERDLIRVGLPSFLGLSDGAYDSCGD